MKDNGNRTKRMEKENSGMPTEMFTKASGSKIKQMDMEFMSISMEPGMRANGGMIFRTVLVRRAGKMAQVTPEIT